MVRALLVLAVVSLFAGSASAQGMEPNVDVRAFSESIARVRFAPPSPTPSLRISRTATRSVPRKLSTPKRVLLTAAAGLGGFYAGGVIGARIEGGCNGCDDPGLKGALIGMPIGAAVAAIATWIVTGR